ncbi:thioredoxin-like domain-containing protein [Nafulsella turpanensis]|uniref:thioredoxin-like domain-containing protein n=1 Tax=Nafulsella turpanensis TaxID=1265690 RepID=UPI000348BEAC|nr:thioredoxin-like domain-containing protein [Nafulsella turpanensis]
MRKAAVNAPEFPTRHGWVNTDRPYTLDEFRGRIVLLDFWTYGCINCQHILPDLQRLEEEYPEELVVIGVHSGKFTAEKENSHIREAILKFGINHPVLNDADYALWNAYAIRAWPTVVLISPTGKVVGQHAGEGIYQVAKPYIEQLLQENRDNIRRSLFTFQQTLLAEQKSSFCFPTKLLAGTGDTLWLSDSGHHRILQLNADGEILMSIGSGEKGFADGTFGQCSFNEPQGLALQDHFLYIADTKNNAIRLANLQAQTLTTLAGTGELDYYFFDERRNEEVLPNSPWDLLIHQNTLYIASAGNHQILQMDLNEKVVKRFAGTGREVLANGSLHDACFNQPSSLSQIGNALYVADAEASAIRAIDLEQGLVYTPLGKGLFDFGDKDGDVEDALLQHNMGLVAHDGFLFIADTYNGKIKQFDLYKERVKTILSGLNEPNDLLFHQGYLWVSDTNNHQLVRINRQSQEKKIFRGQ